MPTLILPGRRIDGRSAPDSRLEIDWAHPLARELRCYALVRPGGMVDLVQAAAASAAGGSPALGVDGHGRRYTISAASSDFLSLPHNPAYNIAGSITVGWLGTIASGGAFRHFAGKHTGGGADANPFDFRTGSDGQTPNLVRTIVGNSQFGVYSASAAVPIGVKSLVAFSQVESSSVLTAPVFYINGSASGGAFSGSGSGSLDIAGNVEPLRIGRRTDGAVQLDGSVQLVFLYARTLDADEHRWLADEPFVVLRESTRRIYSFGAGAPPGASGSGTGTLQGIGSSASASVAVVGSSSTPSSAVAGPATGVVVVAATSTERLRPVAGQGAAVCAIAGSSQPAVSTVTGSASGALTLSGQSLAGIGALYGLASGSLISGLVGQSSATLLSASGVSGGLVAVSAANVSALRATSGSGSASSLIAGTSSSAIASVYGFSAGSSTGSAVGVSGQSISTAFGSASGAIGVSGASLSIVLPTRGAALAATLLSAQSSAALARLAGTASAAALLSGHSQSSLNRSFGLASGSTSAVIVGGAGAELARFTGVAFASLGAIPPPPQQVNPRYVVRGRARFTTIRARARTLIIQGK